MTNFEINKYFIYKQGTKSKKLSLQPEQETNELRSGL